jgi:hypothetical protein
MHRILQVPIVTVRSGSARADWGFGVPVADAVVASVLTAGTDDAADPAAGRSPDVVSSDAEGPREGPAAHPPRIEIAKATPASLLIV